MGQNKTVRYIPKVEVNTHRKFFNVAQLVRQSWFPIKSRSALRKHIASGEILAHLANPNSPKKLYLVYEEDAHKFVDLWSNADTKPKRFRIGKDYFPIRRLVKEKWFPISSVGILFELIQQGQIKAVDVSANPKQKRYYIHKNDVIKYIKKLTYKSLRAKRQ